MDNLRKMQIYQLDILLKFKEVCERNNLKYFLIGGTLLGAVRHKGFIPWDDDIDVGMPREDYEKFLKIGQKELGTQYLLRNWYVEKKYAWPHSMVCLAGSRVYHGEDKNSKEVSEYIGIDVFAFDTKTKDFNKFKKQQRKARILKWLFFGKTNIFTLKGFNIKKIAYCISTLIARFIPRSFLISNFNKNAKQYNNEISDAIADIGGLQGINDWVEYDASKEIPELEFEGYAFKVPQNYDGVLSRYYGNYMELPPEEERTHKHGVTRCDFGSYVPKCYIDFKD